MEKCRTSNGALRNSSIDWMLLQRLPIQKHTKPSVTEKRQNKAECMTWNITRFEFVKKTRMSNPVESLGYIKYYSMIALYLVNTLLALPDITIKRSTAGREDLKPYCKSERKPHFSRLTGLLFIHFTKILLTTKRRRRW